MFRRKNTQLQKEKQFNADKFAKDSERTLKENLDKQAEPEIYKDNPWYVSIFKKRGN
jgi:hypothetical protein